jgi:hypothetical protein
VSPFQWHLYKVTCWHSAEGCCLQFARGFVILLWDPQRLHFYACSSRWPTFLIRVSVAASQSVCLSVCLSVIEPVAFGIRQQQLVYCIKNEKYATCNVQGWDLPRLHTEEIISLVMTHECKFTLFHKERFFCSYVRMNRQCTESLRQTLFMEDSKYTAWLVSESKRVYY